jgi:hypothetical protein
MHAMADHWTFWIESRRWMPGEGAWRAAPDSTADTWFLWGEQHDDRRCFGTFGSRADAEKSIERAREHMQKQEQAKDEPRPQGYHISQDRNGTEDEITIHAPGGRELAYIWFWDEEYDQPGVGDQQAKADARHIVDALNAYGPDSAPGQAAQAKPYYAGIVPKAIFGEADALSIHAPDGRGMAFIDLPDRYGRSEAQLQADVQLIVDALNAYQPRHTPGKETPAPGTVELAAALFDSGAAASTEEQKESMAQDRQSSTDHKHNRKQAFRRKGRLEERFDVHEQELGALAPPATGPRPESAGDEQVRQRTPPGRENPGRRR